MGYGAAATTVLGIVVGQYLHLHGQPMLRQAACAPGQLCKSPAPAESRAFQLLGKICCNIPQKDHDLLNLFAIVQNHETLYVSLPTVCRPWCWRCAGKTNQPMLPDKKVNH